MKDTVKSLNGGIYFSSPVQELLTKEDILSQFDKLEGVLDRKCMDYLYDLYKLRSCALALEECMDDLELGSVIDSVFFKRLVIYNIFNKYHDIADEDSYSNFSAESNTFEILSNDHNDLLYKFDFNYGFPDLYLFMHNVLSFSEKKAVLKNKIDELSNILAQKKTERNPHRNYNMSGHLTFGSVSNKWSEQHNDEIAKLEEELDKYSSLSDADLRDMHERDILLRRRRNRILKYILFDCNLDLNLDFVQDKNDSKKLVKQYGYANIHIENTGDV